MYGSTTATSDKLQRCLELHTPVDIGNTSGGAYGIRSTTTPYGPPFRSVLASGSDYGDSGLGGGGGYDPTAGGMTARTPSDFYRAASSSNDYAYIQETSTPPPMPTHPGVGPTSFGPRRVFGGGQTGSPTLVDGSGDVVTACRAPYSTLERSDSIRSGQQLLQHHQPLMMPTSHPRGSTAAVHSPASGVDQWSRHQRMVVASMSPMSSDGRCIDQA